MRVVAILLLLALALPGAAAQLPITACGPLSIPADPAAPAPVAAGERADLVVRVTNGGNLAATVTVTGTTTEPGWTFASTPVPTSIAAGASQDFTFTLEAGPDASRDALVSFAASGTCDSPLGQNCPGTACVAGSANTQVNVPFQPAEGFRLPGLGALAVPIEYLIAGIVLVGLATVIPLAMRKRRVGIVATCPEPLKMVKPGRGTSFPIELRNGSKQALSATFDVGKVPEGWNAFMPLPDVQLAGRESRSLWLMVRSPPDALQGQSVDVELRLRAPSGELGSPLRVRAEVHGSAGDP